VNKDTVYTSVTNYVPTLSVRRPCNVYWHVTANYKLSFIIIIITRIIRHNLIRHLLV